MFNFLHRPVDKVFNDLLTIAESGLALRAEEKRCEQESEVNGKLSAD
jgi:hypothetical protein